MSPGALAIPRETVALAVLVAGALVMLGWVALAGGELHGTVVFMGCPGTIPEGGQLSCVKKPIPNATIVAVQAQHAYWESAGRGKFVLPSPLRAVATARSDGSGAYRLGVPAGDFLVGAMVENWTEYEGNGISTLPFSVAGQFFPVYVDKFSSARYDLGIRFDAA